MRVARLAIHGVEGFYGSAVQLEGIEVLFTKRKEPHLSDPRYPGEVNPRGYITHGIKERNSFTI